MRTVAFGLALCMVFAGCLANQGSSSVELPLATEIFQVSPGAYGETFLATAGDTVLSCTHGGFVAASPTFVSEDGGKNWSPFSTGAPFPSGDCDVAISPAKARVVLYDNVWGVTTAVSRDEGATWALNHHGAPPVSGAVDRPWVDWVGERLLLSYKSVQYHPTIVATSYSDDDGATWSTPNVLDFALDADFPAAVQSDFHIMDDGTAWTFLTSYQTNPLAENMGFQAMQRYEAIHTVDGGLSWVRTLVHEGPGEVINGAGVGGDQYLWWAYAAPADGGEAIWILHSDDRGETWSDPVAVATGENFDTPAIAGRADGTASLIVLNRVGGAFVDLIRLDTAEPGLVTDSVRIRDDNSLPQAAEFMDITHNDAGEALAVFVWDEPDVDCGGSLNPLANYCLWLVRES